MYKRDKYRHISTPDRPGTVLSLPWRGAYPSRVFKTERDETGTYY